MATVLGKEQETKGFYKLSWVQRIGFGAGDLAQNLIYQTICMYLLFFYTDVYVLGGDAAKSAGLAGTMFLVVRLVDVLWDPLVGTFVDKHNPIWGKYRSYLVMGGIPLTILAILCFWDGFAPSLIYAYITYVGMSMLYTLLYRLVCLSWWLSLPRRRHCLLKWRCSWVWARCLRSSSCLWFRPSRRRWVRRICSTSS